MRAPSCEARHDPSRASCPLIRCLEVQAANFFLPCYLWWGKRPYQVGEFPDLPIRQCQLTCQSVSLHSRWFRVGIAVPSSPPPKVSPAPFPRQPRDRRARALRHPRRPAVPATPLAPARGRDRPPDRPLPPRRTPVRLPSPPSPPPKARPSPPSRAPLRAKTPA